LAQNLSKHKEFLYTTFQKLGIRYKRYGQYANAAGHATTSAQNILEVAGFANELSDNPYLQALYDTGKKSLYASVKPILEEYCRDTFPKDEEYVSLEEKGERLLNFMGEKLGSKEKVRAANERAKAQFLNLVPIYNPFRGVGAQQDFYFFCSKENKVLKNVDSAMYFKVTKTTPEEVAERGVMSTADYNPYKSSPFFFESGKNMVNTYTPATWTTIADIEPGMPSNFVKLFEHLFPGANDREYVLDWMHYMLVRRNQTILCLVGPHGTGKTIFMNLLKTLVGNHGDANNSSEARRDSLLNQFNSEFVGKRLVAFDELELDDDQLINRLKHYLNDEIPVEMKGVDAAKVKNFASFVMASNNKQNFQVSESERRFSTPRPTDKKLLETFTSDQVTEIVLNWSDPYSLEVAQLGNYLLSRKPVATKSEHDPLKNNYYYELCDGSMAQWKKNIIRTSTLFGRPFGGMVPFSKYEEMAPRNSNGKGKNFPSHNTSLIKDFLSMHREKGKYLIGQYAEKWVDDKIVSYIELSKDFMEYCCVGAEPKRSTQTIEDGERDSVWDEL